MVNTESAGKAHDLVLFGAGTMAWPAYEVARAMEKNGAKVAAVNLRFTKPLDEETIINFSKNARHIMVLEEGNKPGGVHSAIGQLLLDRLDTLPTVHSASIFDEFANHGTQNELKSEYGLMTEQLINHCTNILQNSSSIA
jgi:deoxyxylulose-5-phosphate synthase